MLPAADTFAQEIGTHDQVDVLDAGQFIVINLHELGLSGRISARLAWMPLGINTTR